MPWLEDLKFPRGYQMGTHKGLLKTPLYDMKNLKNIGKKGYPSIRGELNRICYDIQFNKEQDRINKFIEIEEEMDEIEK